MLAQRYLDLLAASLTGELTVENEFRTLYLRRCLAGKERFDPKVCLNPKLAPDWEHFQHLVRIGRLLDDDLENLGFSPTMIGRVRLEHLRKCLDCVRQECIPGDLMECGVWRGGACLFLRGYLEAYDMPERSVWVADSFQGLPPPRLAEDSGEDLSAVVYPQLAVSRDVVEENFRRYGLLDTRVRILEGWFRDTLPSCDARQLALLRIDADLFESTRDVLQSLYERVSPGGFLIVDDYHCMEACRKAVDAFRQEHQIEEPLHRIDWTAVYWRKSQR